MNELGTGINNVLLLNKFCLDVSTSCSLQTEQQNLCIKSLLFMYSIKQLLKLSFWGFYCGVGGAYGLFSIDEINLQMFFSRLIANFRHSSNC